MRKFKIGKISMLAFGLVAVISGCGREQAASPASPTVIAAFPANGATSVVLNTTVTAGFSSVMAPATINPTTFTVTGPGGAAVAGAVSYSGTVATFTPAASLAANSVFIATITTGAQDPGGNALAANFTWSFTTGAPTVISTIPATGATAVPVNTVLAATFSEAMNPATLTAATFTLTGPGATPVAGAITYSGATATFTPTVVLAARTFYTATVTTGAKDPAGAPLAANFVWTFTTAPPPSVVSVTPLNGATAVALNTAVSATFSEAMNSATITAATFTLTGPAATPVAGAVTYSGTTATFTPAAALATSTLYTATISIGAKDPTGAPLAANFVWSFTTTPPPTIVSTIPANGATAVAINTPISATFSEAMNPATITAATFTLTGPAATPVAGAVTYAGTTATFTPTAVLAINTLYTATITTGAKDPSGIPLAANSVWTFTTGAPTVISTVPANGATAVPANTLVSATFSGPMDPVTISGTTFTVTGPGATPVAGAVTYAGSTATFTPAAILATTTLFTATITTGAKDPAGTPLAANFVWTFTTAPPPTVVSTIPVNGAAGVAINTLVSATFSEAMDPTTITGTTFTLTGPGTTPVAGAVTYAGTTATFTPTAVLATNTAFTATITTGAKDLTGTPLATNFVWTFTTGLQPTVTSTNPASGATNVPLNQKVTATFSAPMTASTIIAPGTFTVAIAGGGAAVPGTVTYNSASNSAIFTPTAALTASTLYTATVTTAAESAQGSALAANYVWNFTTGVDTNAGAPLVTSTDPANAAINVPLNQRVAATFSTSMDPATISAAGTFTVAVAGGGPAVPGTVSYAGRTAVFVPTTTLAASTLYTATITTAAKDLTGVAMTANYVWNFTTGLTANLVAPTITLTNPASAAVNVPIDMTVNATFSTAMDPTTITNATFTLAVAGIGGAPVEGTVAYDSASQIATFTPSTTLAGNTQYTATISNLVTDLSGNALGNGSTPNPWSFTTSAVVGPGPTTINLGAAGSFAIMATAATTSTGPTEINGNVGLHPGTSQGIPPPQINGTIHINDAVEAQAQASLLAAFNDATSRSTNAQVLPGNMGGLIFTPGLYVNSTSVLLMGAGPNNNVTLDAQGDPNAVFIFKMGSTLTTAPGSQVVLVGGAKAANIFWQVGSSATIDTTTIFKGNVLAAVTITVNAGAAVEGRLFAGSAGDPTGAVTVNDSTVTVPAP